MKINAMLIGGNSAANGGRNQMNSIRERIFFGSFLPRRMLCLEMNELPPEDLHHLRAAEGWLELGDHLSASEELDKIPSSLSDCPQVLMLRWQVYARARHWESAYEIANALVKMVPDEPVGWIHRSYVLHEQRRTQEAWDQLLPAWERFPVEPTIAYNLACYACQLGRLQEAWTWLERAFAMDDSQSRIFRREALEDPDLQPLRDKLTSQT